MVGPQRIWHDRSSAESGRLGKSVIPLLGVRRAIRHGELVARLAESWFHRLPTPNRAVIDVTRRCNQRCNMCNTWQTAPEHELSVAELTRVLRSMGRLTWLDITGGEVFLRRDARELLKAALTVPSGLRILHFPTNGWFTDRIVDTVRDLVSLRPDVTLIVTVSIDGPAHVHDEIRGRKGSFERALATYEQLTEIEGVDVYIGTTVTPDSLPHLDELERRLTARVPTFRRRAWHWNLLQVSGHFFANEHLGAAMPPVGEWLVAHIMGRGLPRTPVALMEMMFLVNLYFHRIGEPVGMHCQALRSSCFISPEGELFPCHIYDRPLGNVRTSGFDAVWNSDDAGARSGRYRGACMWGVLFGV